MIISLCTACVKKPGEMVGPTMGSVDIIADESIKYIVEQEENIFERSYKYANLTITYLPERDMFEKFMTDTTQVIMTTRTLTAEELKFLDEKQSHPVQSEFATGALAFITRKNSADTVFTYEQMISMFNEAEKGKVFVIENAKSGISREILEIIKKPALPSHIYALNSKKEVIEYVSTHDNAIGIVDWSEISDSDDPNAKEILNTIDLVGISRPLDSIQYGYIKPYQYNLQDKKYPFTRQLYIISRTGKSDIGTGFTSFIAGDIGQKIILKSGLLPKYQNERIIEMKYTADIKVVK